MSGAVTFTGRNGAGRSASPALQRAQALAVCCGVIRGLFATGVCALALSACIGSSADGSEEGSTGDDSEVTSNVSVATAEGSDTGSLLEGCGDNLLDDPGFEGGTPNEAWMADSPLFGTPICSVDCTDDVGAGPFVGDWWVWFGGVAQPDTPFVRQNVLIPDGLAMLRFGFSVNAGSGTGNDVFTVSIDDETQLQISDAEVASYGGWRLVEVDVSSFADGGEHTLSFSASIAGVGLTNFFIDEVELLPCEEPSASSGTTAAAGSSTTG